jgi:hypothetical protein
MKTTQGIFLYSSLSQTSKNVVFLFIVHAFSSTKSENKRVEQVLPGGGWRGEVAKIIYTYVSKCKNDK